MTAANPLRTSFRLLLLISLLVMGGVLSGCGVGTVATGGGVVSLHLQGTVHGGQQPVSASSLQLW